MPLRTKILASKINNLSDARYFAAYPVDWLSFIGNPDAEEYIPIDQINEILGWIEGPKVIMDARGCTPTQIQSFTSEVVVSGLLIHSEQSVSAEQEEHYDIFRIIQLSLDSDLSVIEANIHQTGNCDYLIFDFQTNGVDTDILFNPIFQSLMTIKPSFIDAAMSVKDVSQFLETGAEGLVITSGQEEKVGLRSFEDIQDLMEELESDEDF